MLGYHFSETSYDLLEGSQEILFEGRSGRWLFWLRLFLDMLVRILKRYQDKIQPLHYFLARGSPEKRKNFVCSDSSPVFRVFLLICVA